MSEHKHAGSSVQLESKVKPSSPRFERNQHALAELVLGQAAGGEVLAQLLGGPLALLIGDSEL